MQRILAGRVVEARLHCVAVSHWAATGEHAGRRGHLLWGQEVVVGHGVLKGVCVVVSVGVIVAVDRQHVNSFMAAQARCRRRRGGLTEGE